MSDEKFKLPASSYDELVKFIKAYNQVTKPTGLSEISKLTGAAPPNISKNVGFFVATGILEGGKMKVPTEPGRQLGQALEHEIPEEISKSWRNIVEEDEFLTKLLTAVSIRKGMDSQTLEAHIAYSAGQPKKPHVMTGARTVIDILKAAELIFEVDGKYVVKQSNANIGRDVDTKDKNVTTSQHQSTQKDQQTQGTLGLVAENTQIKIHVNINCTPNEIPGLGNQIKSLIHEITGDKASGPDGDK